jgi:hypothetical protein
VDEDPREPYGQIAYEEHCRRGPGEPGDWPAPPSWGDLTDGYREVWRHVGSAVAARAVHDAGMAPADVMAEIERLRDMIRSLASERDDLRAALKRHTCSFTDSKGAVLCGGCLREAPCPDAGLAGDEPP